MPPKEGETLHHAPFDPWEQRTETCRPSFEESTFSILCQAAMFPSTMPPQGVKACKSDVAQLTRDRSRSDRLARFVESSRLCNAAGAIMGRQALRS